MNYGEGYSLSDIAAATGNNRGNDGFGDGFGAWWIIIFLIFAFGGWGGRGFGGYGNEGSNGSSVMDAYVLNSDFATLQRLNESGFDRLGQAINQVNNGLCTGFYQEAQLVNGLSSQLASCCCDIREAISNTNFNISNGLCGVQRSIDGVNYNMAMNTNQIQNAMCNNTRDIVEAQNCGTRAILDAITANRIEDKNAQIQAQQNEINALRLAASQEKQNNYLIDQLKPCPIPAYITCNPYQSYGYNGYSNGGCGCNNNF